MQNICLTFVRPLSHQVQDSAGVPTALSAVSIVGHLEPALVNAYLAHIFHI